MFSMYWGVLWSSSFRDFSYFSLVYKKTQTPQREGHHQEDASQALCHAGPHGLSPSPPLRDSAAAGLTYQVTILHQPLWVTFIRNKHNEELWPASKKHPDLFPLHPSSPLTVAASPRAKQMERLEAGGQAQAQPTSWELFNHKLLARV